MLNYMYYCSGDDILKRMGKAAKWLAIIMRSVVASCTHDTTLRASSACSTIHHQNIGRDSSFFIHVCFCNSALRSFSHIYVIDSLCLRYDIYVRTSHNGKILSDCVMVGVY